MKALRRIWKRVLNFVTSQTGDQRLREEMEEHVAMQTEENLRAGMSASEARRKAVLQWGAREAIREQYHAEKGLPGLETLVQDLRDALRQLRKAPGFSATVIITLALGIGATTAIFTLVHQVMLKSLPVAKPGELWRIGDKIRCCNWGGYTRWRFFAVLVGGLQELSRAHSGVRRPRCAAGGECSAGCEAGGFPGCGADF
jgi:macrolide transport system ATP-binding/permease protein